MPFIISHTACHSAHGHAKCSFVQRVQEQSEQLDVVDATPPEEGRPDFLHRPAGRNAVIGALAAFVLIIALFTSTYLKYARLIDRRLKAGAFSQSVNIYAAPETLAVGDPLTAAQIVARLRQSGYTVSPLNPVGRYNLRPHGIEIYPGPESYSGPDPAVLQFAGGHLSKIVSLADNTERTEYQIEPRLLMNLSDKNREKRHIVRYAEIPPALVHAVVAVEDKRFFRHHGLNIPRMLEAAWVDLRQGRKEQGASTLSMQLARNLWLVPQKSFRRKIDEIVITMHLEHKLSKQQIFENYANQVYLGRRGTFSINGFGQAASDYFGKELSQITLDEAALLAGMIQRPSYYNPYRFPDRARERRNLVLALMRNQRYLTAAECQRASAAPIGVSSAGETDAMSAQYFVDLMNQELQSGPDDSNAPTSRIYTTLDVNLQRAAEEAVATGMQAVDQQLARRRKKEGFPATQPQVALIALDPHTGRIKALVGGRSYGTSQLNHVLASRQPGSSFKPFVYAAALNTAVNGGQKIFTPATIVEDQPTTFQSTWPTLCAGKLPPELHGRRDPAHGLGAFAECRHHSIGADDRLSIGGGYGSPLRSAQYHSTHAVRSARGI